MQVLKLISSLVFMVKPLCVLSRALARPVAAIVRYIRPSSALTRACYVLLGITLLLGALNAEQDGRRGCAIVLATVGAILLILRKIAPLVAMRGTVKYYNDMKGFGFIVPDDVHHKAMGHNNPLLVSGSDVVEIGPWFGGGARVAFKARCGKGDIATRCLRVTRDELTQDSSKPNAPQVSAQVAQAPQGGSGPQTPSDLLKSGWVRKGVAVDKAGGHVMSDDPAATAWSLCGAVNAVYKPDTPLWKSYMIALQAQVGQNLVRWNGAPGRTQGDVVAVALEAERIVEQPEKGRKESYFRLEKN